MPFISFSVMNTRSVGRLNWANWNGWYAVVCQAVKVQILVGNIDNP